MIVDCTYLRSAGRDIILPFDLEIKNNGEPVILHCTEILRLLPGKRMVVSCSYNNSSPMVAKIFLDSSRGKLHCTREEHGVMALLKAGIKTSELVLKGEFDSGSCTVLCFRKISPSENFRVPWNKADCDEKRLHLINLAVSVIAKMHDNGLMQNDIHPDNFLVSKNELYVIDGDAIVGSTHGKPLSTARGLKNLALFFAQFYSRFDRLIPEAMKTYCENRHLYPEKDLVNALMKNVRSQRRLREKKYLDKIYRECTAFVCRKNWKNFLVIDRQYDNEDMKRFLADPDHYMDEGELLKNGESSTVAIVSIGARPVVVKRYNIKNHVHLIKRMFRPSRAWVSWKNSHRLCSMGVLTPKPVALFEKRYGPLRSKAYFITEYQKGMDVLNLVLSGSMPDFDLSLADRFFDLFKEFAMARISHGDFKATNFMDIDNQLFVTDLDAMKRHLFNPGFKAAFLKDMDRFLENWVHVPKIHKIFKDRLAEIKI